MSHAPSDTGGVAASLPRPPREARRARRGPTGPGPVVRRVTAAVLRLAVTVVALVAAWAAAVAVFAPPAWLVPSPRSVAAVFVADGGFLLRQAAVTGAEILAGLAIGTLAGVATAVLLASLPPVRRALMPVVALTQALPVFALAPLLVVWFGYGMASKVVMATLIIYFPVASAYADGMLRADRGLVDLARLHGAGPIATLVLIRMPAGLPHLLAGLRVAASLAPIGAVVGEWVGASAGLGFLMIQANARLETDTLFAALFLLALMTLALRAAVDLLIERSAAWAPESG